MAQLDEELERDGDEAEAGGAEEGEDSVGTGHAARLGHPEEDEVAEGDERHGGADGGEECLGAVEEGGGEDGGYETGENEDGAAQAGFLVVEAVGGEHLVQEGGARVEEAYVDGEGDEDEVDFQRAGRLAERRAEGRLRCRRRRGDGSRRGGGDEQGGKGENGGLFIPGILSPRSVTGQESRVKGGEKGKKKKERKKPTMIET